MSAPTDFELLQAIPQFYAVVEAPPWKALLQLLMDITRARGGSVSIAEDHGVRELCRLGEVPAVIDQLPSEPAVHFTDEGARVRLRHEVYAHETLWSLHGCCEDPRRRVRLTALARHLQLAVDFQQGRAIEGAAAARLQASAERRAGVERVLATLSPRSAACALLAARSYTNAQIGDYLGMPATSVARALREVYRAFGILGRSDLDVVSLLSLPKPGPLRR